VVWGGLVLCCFVMGVGVTVVVAVYSGMYYRCCGLWCGWGGWWLPVRARGLYVAVGCVVGFGCCVDFVLCLFVLLLSGFRYCVLLGYWLICVGLHLVSMYSYFVVFRAAVSLCGLLGLCV